MKRDAREIDGRGRKLQLKERKQVKGTSVPTGTPAYGSYMAAMLCDRSQSLVPDTVNEIVEKN